MNDSQVSHRYVSVKGFNLFYREAGRPEQPTILLLHGFPTSSHMFRQLIPLLAQDFHVLAPDLPGFGLSDAPSRESFRYTFDRLASVIGDFVEAKRLARFALYIFDYGAPVGLRVALRFPERIAALIVQNGNAYLEGLGDTWEAWRRYWQVPTPENREACRDALSPAVIRDIQYLQGCERELVSPDGYTLDLTYLSRAGHDEIQLDLVLDYRTNLARYPEFQQFFRSHRPPTIVLWGKNDPFFLAAGALAYQKDNPDARVVFYDTGHFALETHGPEIAAEISAFLPAARWTPGD